LQQYTYSDSAGNHPYFVYTPQKYQAGTTVPLVVMLHGCAQSAADFATGTSMNQLAEQYGFVVVYPQQMSSYNGNLCLPERVACGVTAWHNQLTIDGPHGRKRSALRSQHSYLLVKSLPSPLGCSRKKRTISVEASGPFGSVYEPLEFPPDQA